MEIVEVVRKSIEEQFKPVIARLDDVEKRLAASPVTGYGAAVGAATQQQAKTPASIMTKAARVKRMVERYSEGDIHKGRALALGAFVRANLAIAKHGLRKSVADVLGEWGYEELAELAKAGVDENVVRALGESTLSAGGALVPPDFSSEFIELLRAIAVVRGLGPRMMPMPRGSLQIPKQTAGGTAYYVGESTNVTPSAQTTGILNLHAKKLMALTVISNELLADASPEADAMVRDDLARVAALREDLAFIRGDGTQSTPTGIRNLANAANTQAATQAGASATLSEVASDAEAIIGMLEDNNVPVDDGCVWLMAPRSRRYLRTLRDGTGAFVYKAELDQGRFMGYRVGLTTQIPTNLNVGGGSNESEVYFVQMREFIVGDTKTLEMTFHPDATYDDSGTIRSGLSRDESAIRAIQRHDCAMRHDYAAAYLSQVKWGA